MPPAATARGNEQTSAKAATGIRDLLWEITPHTPRMVAEISGKSQGTADNPVQESSGPTLHLRGQNRSFLRERLGAARASWPRWRLALAAALESRTGEIFVGAIIIANFYVICVEVNSSADCDSDDCMEPEIVAVNWAFTLFYTVELMLRFFVQGCRAGCRDLWTLLDTAVVLLSWFEHALEHMIVRGSSMDININFLRIFRVARLVRATQVLQVFPELHAMIVGLASAMMAMVWGGIMIMLLLLVFSILAVEFVHPVNKGLAHSDEWCETAFSSVETSTLVFFQTLVAGDSWGHCAVPVIRKHPALFVLFASALVCVQLGLTNLILSAIVDSASKAREAEKESRAERAKIDRRENTDRLANLLEEIDTDESGTLSFEEFEKGYYENKDLRGILENLKLSEHDLWILFDVMDTERRGQVSYYEFIYYISSFGPEQLQQHLLLARLLQRREDMADGRRSAGGSRLHTPPGSPGLPSKRTVRASRWQDPVVIASPPAGRGEQPSMSSSASPSTAGLSPQPRDGDAAASAFAPTTKDEVRREMDAFARQLEAWHVQSANFFSQTMHEFEAFSERIRLLLRSPAQGGCGSFYGARDEAGSAHHSRLEEVTAVASTPQPTWHGGDSMTYNSGGIGSPISPKCRAAMPTSNSLLVTGGADAPTAATVAPLASDRSTYIAPPSRGRLGESPSPGAVLRGSDTGGSVSSAGSSLGSRDAALNEHEASNGGANRTEAPPVAGGVGSLAPPPVGRRPGALLTGANIEAGPERGSADRDETGEATTTTASFILGPIFEA